MATPASFIERLTDLLKNYTDKLEQQDHPRLWEWMRDCETLREAGTPEERILPFAVWLKKKEQEETNAAPKIRGANPPVANLQAASALWDEVAELRAHFLIALVACFAGLLFLVVGQAFFGLLVMVGAGYVAHHFMQKWQQKTDERLPLTKPVPLDAFNTEFTSPLSDRSILRITVHFQVPRNMNTQHFVEQLNRVTEAKLITHTQEFAEPLSRFEIEDYLNRQLVQFQDENEVGVLRASVPITIHVHPDKPRGVHV